MKKIIIQVSEDALAELTVLKNREELPSYIELIRSSIALFKFLSEERNTGADIIIRRGKEEKKHVRLK